MPGKVGLGPTIHDSQAGIAGVGARYIYKSWKIEALMMTMCSGTTVMLVRTIKINP